MGGGSPSTAENWRTETRGVSLWTRSGLNWKPPPQETGVLCPLEDPNALEPPGGWGGRAPIEGGGALVPLGAREVELAEGHGDLEMALSEQEEEWWVEMERRFQVVVGEMDYTQKIVRRMQQSEHEAVERVSLDIQILQRSLLGEEGLDGEVVVVREVSPRELSRQVRGRLEEMRRAQQVANQTLSEKIQGLNGLEGRVSILEQRGFGAGSSPPPAMGEGGEGAWQELQSKVTEMAGALENLKGISVGAALGGGGLSPGAAKMWEERWTRLQEEGAQLQAQMQELRVRLTTPPQKGGVEQKLQAIWDARWVQVERSVQKVPELVQSVGALQGQVRNWLQQFSALEGMPPRVSDAERQLLGLQDSVRALGALSMQVESIQGWAQRKKADGQALEERLEHFVGELREWQEWSRQLGERVNEAQSPGAEVQGVVAGLQRTLEEMVARDKVREEGLKALADENQHLQERNVLLERQNLGILSRLEAMEMRLGGGDGTTLQSRRRDVGSTPPGVGRRVDRVRPPPLHVCRGGGGFSPESTRSQGMPSPLPLAPQAPAGNCLRLPRGRSSVRASCPLAAPTLAPGGGLGGGGGGDPMGGDGLLPPQGGGGGGLLAPLEGALGSPRWG